ncbi:alpha/beta hydrolase [Demequina zhanjiangensis]|uniref:Alpha/beta hydrolase n=1 Tax=Demequina zhanjiangensis TaxID=3051659 RepID=A0ABT8FYV7_9MICO|nr:alpha/beta hydrolase [Demequina sp. SYSU T00b26]MDN4472073.1 alpha/beta hydrolase [Demequina sp. SYSU T00b26]
MTSRRHWVALAAVSALALAACSPGDLFGGDSSSPSENGAPSSSAPADASAYYEQTLDWSSCGDFECANVEVPLDWTDPGGESIEIAINRAPATSSDARVGSLLINPGGPGGSGLDFLEYFTSYYGDSVAAAYDVIGFDPRGVGESTGIECGDGDVLDEYYITDYSFETEDDLAAADQRTAEFAAGCQELTGDLIANVDTVSAARDMDVIRAVVGDDQLNFVGASYGTQLGATYAELYPDTVGHMVLDGAVDFLLDDIEAGKGQAAGFETALTSFLEYCQGEPTCPLSADMDTAREQIGDLARDALESPLPTGEDGLEVNGNLMVYGIVVTLYSEDSWPYLLQAINEVYTQGTAFIFYQLAGFYLDRDTISGEYTANSTIAFTAISCLDSTDRSDWTVADQQELTAAMEEASPTFGWWFASGGGCSAWPWVAHQTIESLDYPDTANPILVVGTTRDPATPYEWAESLTEQLGNAVLLTYDGDGHTAYGRSNDCIGDTVDEFLVDGTVPDSGLVC